MKKQIMIKYGEISLKGLNRRFFIDTLINNINFLLKGYEKKVFTIQSRIMIKDYDLSKEDEIIEEKCKW